MNKVFRLLAAVLVASFVLSLAGFAFAADIGVGDTVIFGNKLQESLHGGVVYGESPIEWVVLAREEDKVLLITRQEIDYQPFGGSTWESSSLRSYLNENFYNTAFTDEEKAVIIPVMVSAETNPMYDTDQGVPTTDRIFLLSTDEVKKYFPTMESRCCTATAYVNGEGSFQGTNGNCNWILRTVGFYSSYVSSVFSYGAIDYFGHNTDDESLAIRPALWIDIGTEAWRNLEHSRNTSNDKQLVEKIKSMDLASVDEILQAGKTSGSSVKIMQDSEDTEDILKQIQLIYNSMDIWKLDGSTSTVMNAVTDFDHNGRLEIVTAENYSSGNYTHFKVWEVNKAKDALIDLGSGIESNFMLTYGRFESDFVRDDVCAPDVIPVRYSRSLDGEPVTEINAYSLPEGNRIYYTFQNFSGNAESWEQVQECLYLEKGELHIFPTAWRQKGEFGSSRYYDYGGNIIGPQQYADWDSFFEGYEKNIVRIYWLWNSTCSVETMLDSYRVFSQGA